MALVAVFLFLVFSFHLPFVPLPGRAPLLQACHLAAAAADCEHLAFFLFGRALHPQVLHHLTESPVDEIQTVDLRHAARVHQCRQAAACRTVDAEGRARGPRAEFAPPRPAQDLASWLMLGLAVDHVRTAQFHLGNATAV